MLRALVGLGALAGLLAASGGLRAADPAARAVAAYLGAAERVRHDASQLAGQIAPAHPEVAEIVRRSLRYLDPEEVDERAAAVFSRHMSAADLEAFGAFMATPLGKRVGETFRANLEPGSLEAAFAKYPPSDTGELDRFFASAPAQNALAAISGEQWQQTWQAYGEILACRYFTHEDPKALAAAQQKGRCLVP
ncbi:MAG TPA: hypothetical protein VFF91_02220 [Pseudoxanthomonas sp.]|nr:hypothetical protein [Pseudoxanthomonas sp.]